MREAVHKVGGAVDGVDDKGRGGRDARRAGLVGLLADEEEGREGLLQARRDVDFDGAVGFGYYVDGCGQVGRSVDGFCFGLFWRVGGRDWEGGWEGGRGAPFILVSGGMLLGLAARIMRPASKATDTSVSCTAWRSTAAILCAV